MDAGDVVISPFKESNLGSNSYDCTLNPTLLVYRQHCLDMNTDNPVDSITIPDSGYVLTPGEFYLGSTNECATSKRYVPCLEGRSSVARLGIAVHQAGFGDVGFAFDDNGQCTYALWTLEVTVTKPVRVYPNRRVCQVFFFDTQTQVDASDPRNMYRGKYSKQMMPQPSMMFKDIELQKGQQ
jgi:dCTP deaminase